MSVQLIVISLNLYDQNDIYELRGVHIRTQTVVCHVMKSMDCLCKHCGAVGLFAICYSFIKPKYWNNKTLVTIADNSNKLYNSIMGINSQHVTAADIPNAITVCGIDILVNTKLLDGDILSCGSLPSKVKLEKIIRDNIHDNNGILLWISGYCITCIFRSITSKYIFSLLTYEDSCEPAVKHNKDIRGIPLLIEATVFVMLYKEN